MNDDIEKAIDKADALLAAANLADGIAQTLQAAREAVFEDRHYMRELQMSASMATLVRALCEDLLALYDDQGRNRRNHWGRR